MQENTDQNNFEYGRFLHSEILEVYSEICQISRHPISVPQLDSPQSDPRWKSSPPNH